MSRVSLAEDERQRHTRQFVPIPRQGPTALIADASKRRRLEHPHPGPGTSRASTKTRNLRPAIQRDSPEQRAAAPHRRELPVGSDSWDPHGFCP
jgi:hypothetical protein